jgi:hypothetical protein
MSEKLLASYRDCRGKRRSGTDGYSVRGSFDRCDLKDVAVPVGAMEIEGISLSNEGAGRVRPARSITGMLACIALPLRRRISRYTRSGRGRRPLRSSRPTVPVPFRSPKRRSRKRSTGTVLSPPAGNLTYHIYRLRICSEGRSGRIEDREQDPTEVCPRTMRHAVCKKESPRLLVRIDCAYS